MPDNTPVALQVRPETSTGPSRARVAVCVLPPRVAVTVALWLLAIEAAAAALKVAADPPAGAVWVSVTVQMPTALCPRLAGLQAKPETSTGASRATVAVCALPP